MKYTVDGLEKKSADWIIVSISDDNANSHHSVSINKTGKKGDVFPNFDEIVEGSVIEGEFWTSGAGKNYLFPPKPKGAGRANMAGMMAKKEESISKFQDKKSAQIEKAQDRSALMWAKVGATELIAHHPAFKSLDMSDIEVAVEKLTTEIYNIEPTKPF